MVDFVQIGANDDAVATMEGMCSRRVLGPWFTASSCLVFGGLLACGGGPVRGGEANPEPMVSWAAADRLFTGHEQWHGADSAYSVDLGGDRILWLFGDSFVGPRSAEDRSGVPMVRNSIAIQHGRDPSTASLQPVVQEPPRAFFGDGEGPWLWPGPGVRVGDVLLLGFMRVAPSEGGLGFVTVGSEVLRVDEPDEAPEHWVPRAVALPPAPASVQLGAGAWMQDGAWLYAFAPVEPGTHDVHLARWPIRSVAEGRLDDVQWWSGTWSDDPAAAVVVVRGVQTEFSVHRESDGRLWMISVDGFGATNIVRRTADAPEGPWSAPTRLIRPSHSERSGILVYSAKAHPELSGGPSPVITYCTNHQDFGTLVGDMDLYVPRFVRPRGS